MTIVTRGAARVVVVAGLLLAAGCGGDDADADGGATLTVLAASSLTDVFTALERVFESEHADVDVELSFDSSSTLAEQVVQGAPGDVLATADEDTMQVVVDGGLTVGDPVVFARNRLVLVTPADNPPVSTTSPIWTTTGPRTRSACPTHRAAPPAGPCSSVSACTPTP